MRFPSKVTPYAESILPMAVKLWKEIPREGISVFDLFHSSKNQKWSTSDFFQILDFLFMIGRVKFTNNKEICNVG